MITLILVHPLPNLPSQSWTFEQENLIRIGRSADNDIILHSAVVSRHHLEIRRRGCRWKIFNLSSNGTYCNQQPIIEAPVIDGMMLRLAHSGPQILIQLRTTAFKNLPPSQDADKVLI